MALEIERKYLVEMPDISKLRQITEVRESKISQTYLTSENDEERRIRTILYPDGNRVFFYTEKRTIMSSHGLVRKEDEKEISYDEWKQLLQEADHSLITIYKTRFVFQMDNLTYELDIYPFSYNRAIMEVELTSESDNVVIPPFINVIKEVTYDKGFKNKSLAKTRDFPS